jgi:hypothetical protein
MGFSQDSMNSYISRDLKKRFPPSQGWKIERKPDWNGISFDFQVMRREYGRVKRYLVAVFIVKKISAEQIQTVQDKLNSLADMGIDKEQMIIFVPTDADTSALPDSFDLMNIRVLKVADNDIIWWKKTPLHG